MRENAVHMDFNTAPYADASANRSDWGNAPYADASANRSGWGEIGDGGSSELQHDLRHWGGQIRLIGVPESEAKISADEDVRDKAA